MKGLIIKDLMCLRKQRITLIFTVISIIVIGILYIISARCGNIYLANQEMIEVNGLSQSELYDVCTLVFILFMLLPIALVGDSATVFIYDGKAGFANVSSSLPVSLNKRVLAKYITVVLMLGIGVALDIVIAFIFSIFTDMLTFTDLVGIIISSASLLSIYGSINILLCFIFGYGKEDWASCFTVLLMIAGIVIPNLSALIRFLKEENTSDGSDWYYLTNLMNFIKYRFYILFGIAAVIMVISYLSALIVTKRKRGMI